MLNNPRSIPASAGQPAHGEWRRPGASVYPRECGAASTDMPPAENTIGLSPRVRGSPPLHLVNVLLLRSIPASAGQPRPAAPASCRPRVYPRECGAAAKEIGIEDADQGLSPRVRGSHARLRSCHFYAGSIPASAGQPGLRTRPWTATTVYPRECGAAGLAYATLDRHHGLSPRVRGSQSATLSMSVSAGSIPASAGQPVRGYAWPACRWVYPRECGAAESRT